MPARLDNGLAAATLVVPRGVSMSGWSPAGFARAAGLASLGGPAGSPQIARRL